MKTKLEYLVLGMVLAVPCWGAAALVVPGADDSDGALHVTENTVIDLSLAATAAWDASYADLAAADAEREEADFVGKGVYDGEKWAVVFRYSSVTVDEGVTVTFMNHPRRAPVVWLVSGNVTVNGVVSLNGGGRIDSAPLLAEGGPGGFRGGMLYWASQVGASAGFGVGGGMTEVNDSGRGASYANPVTSSPPAYGNPSLVPLIGGSGGGGGRYYGGAGGGGAILIASADTFSVGVNGRISANGAAGRADTYNDNRRSGGGSGGGIRVVAETLAGDGDLVALGGGGTYPGSVGRIRLERVNNDSAYTELTPEASVVGLEAGATALIWPPTTAPAVEIVSIGATDDSVVGDVPDDPSADFGADGADVILPQMGTAKVVVETSNVEKESQVFVRRTLRTNGNYAQVLAVLEDPEATGDPLRWVAEVPVTSGQAAFQVRVVRP